MKPSRNEPMELIVAEPPMAYRVSPPIVIDCNMICAVLFQEAERAQAEARLAGRQLNAPSLLDYEVASVAQKKAQQGGAVLVGHALARYVALPIRLHAVGPRDVVALAQRYTLSAYDAAYLWLAATLKAPLATFDRKLGEAARRHLADLE